MRTDANGKFETGGLQPGSYLVAAVKDGWLAFDWREPEMLRELSNVAVAVAVGSAESASVTLKASVIP
jgi:hypothetical protein